MTLCAVFPFQGFHFNACFYCSLFASMPRQLGSTKGVMTGSYHRSRSSTYGSFCPAQPYACRVLSLLLFWEYISNFIHLSHYNGLNRKFMCLKIRPYIPEWCCHPEWVHTICVWLSSVQIYRGPFPDSSSLQLLRVGLSFCKLHSCFSCLCKVS